MAFLLRRFRSELVFLAGLVALQALSFIGVRRAGFSAVSDDDYARVVIAQHFVESPSLDPSGTSWLPFPFLHQGLAMMLFSPTLEFARVWSFISACAATTLLFLAARRVGLRPPLAATTAAIAALLPHAVYLSAATVPEYLTAALVVFALGTLLDDLADARAPWLGGVCLLLAAASRYEAWPVALGFAGIRLWDAQKTRSAAPLVSAALALCFPVLWLLHGQLAHQNAFFFIKRVADYKAALDAGTSGSDVVLTYLKALLLAEPEAALATLGLVALVTIKHRKATLARRWLRSWLPLAVMYLFLVASASQSGAPTHHEERALLPIWLFSVLTSAGLIENARLNWKQVAPALLLGIGLGATVRQSELFERDGFTARRQEEELGRHLRNLAGAHTPIGLNLDDFGYFAVMAAAGQPHRFSILDAHDPRTSARGRSLFEQYRTGGGCLVVEPAKLPAASDLQEIEQLKRWSLRRFHACSHPTPGPATPE